MTNTRKIRGPEKKDSAKTQPELKFGNRTAPDSLPSSPLSTACVPEQQIRLQLSEVDGPKVRAALARIRRGSGEDLVGMRVLNTYFGSPIAKDSAAQTILEYVVYLDNLRSYCRSMDDLFGDSSMTEPREPAKGLVVAAINACDTSDKNVMKALFEIADRAEDREIRAEAQRAILRKAGSAFTGIRPLA